jgi:diacylglycerol kinase family enzyme
MRTSNPGKRRHTPKPLYGIVLNSGASGYSQEQVDILIRRIARRKANWHIIDMTAEKDAIREIRQLLSRKPVGIIACGGDSTVNFVGRYLVRRTSVLGILPLGKFNNIFRSLYGTPDSKKAIAIILSGHNRKIDCGMASGKFFLGTIALGLVPNLYEYIGERRLPKFGIGWSRAASQAAAAVEPASTTLSVDEFRFKISPLTLNINLLSHAVGLPFMPAAIDNDGRMEITFDAGKGEAILSSYVRQVFKQKYVYSDEIKMYRGKKIAITPVPGNKMYLDGEIIRLENTTLEIDTFPARIRIFREGK